MMYETGQGKRKKCKQGKILLRFYKTIFNTNTDACFERHI